MTPVAIIGIGSPFGADRLGWEVVELLKQHSGLRGYLPERATLASCDRPGIGLLEYMHGTPLAILVDAVQAGLTPGDIVRWEGDQIKSLPSHYSTHGFGISEALALGHSLGDLPHRTVLLGMEVGDDTQRIPDHRNISQLAEKVLEEVRGFYNAQPRAVI